jgi:hypothetical protein
LRIAIENKYAGLVAGEKEEHSCRKSVMVSVKEQELIMLSTILVVILILILVGALPTWGYSSGWGYGPGGIVGVLLIVVIVLALTGRI